MLKLFTAATLSVVALAGVANASLIASDGFENTTLGVLGGNAGGTGWAGPWTSQASGANVVGGGLNYSNGSVQVSGGSRAVSVTASFDTLLNRQFTATAAGVDEVYFSFLFQQNVGAASDFLDFWVSGVNNRTGSGGIGDHYSQTATSEQNFSSRVTDTGNAFTTSTAVSPYLANQTYLLVGRLSKEGNAAITTRFDRVELWVNPTSQTLGTPNAVVDASIGRDNGFSYFGLRTVNVASTDDYRFDELRIGTTVVDVVAVPEPMSLGLLGLAGLALVRRRA